MAAFPSSSMMTTFPLGLRPTAASLALHDQSLDGSFMDLAIAAIPKVPGLSVILMPLFQIVHAFVLKKGKYDIQNLTAKIALVFGAASAIKFGWNFLGPILVNTFTSSLTIPGEYQMTKDIQAWIAKNIKGSAKRHAKLTSDGFKYNKSTGTLEMNNERQTSMESGWFMFQGYPMHFRLNKADKAAVPASTPDTKITGDTMTLSCLGFADNTLMNFLKDVLSEKPQILHATGLYTVLPGGHGITTGHLSYVWQRKDKPTRPLSTIDLDKAIKANLVDDIEKFLAPSREQWYRNRGIPYSRGYLFAGSPGTGKSSTSLALAGLTEGNLWMISINEVEDEAHLKRLFSDPKKGDIILLEDVDSAGIGREKMSENKEKSQKSRISLSGLLNTIDTARKDGVILIMTTNEPESLDAALIRPGRIDKTVVFGLVDRDVAKSIFQRIYQQDDVNTSANVDTPANDLVLKLAEQFATKVPPRRFTPAEIQGFLNPIDEPGEALSKTDNWVSELLEAKAKGKKIVEDFAKDDN
jgi:chaperone BCS1